MSFKHYQPCRTFSVINVNIPPSLKNSMPVGKVGSWPHARTRPTAASAKGAAIPRARNEPRPVGLAVAEPPLERGGAPP